MKRRNLLVLHNCRCPACGLALPMLLQRHRVEHVIEGEAFDQVISLRVHGHCAQAKGDARQAIEAFAVAAARALHGQRNDDLADLLALDSAEPALSPDGGLHPSSTTTTPTGGNLSC